MVRKAGFLVAVIITLFVSVSWAEDISTPTVAKITAIPAIASRVNSGRAETFTASATSSEGHALEYQFIWGDGNVGTWGTATQTHTYTYTAAATYNVTVQARCAADGVYSAVSAPLAVTTEEFSYSVDSTAYAAWASFGRKPCWCYPRQCRGDIDGRKIGLYWCSSLDLACLKICYSKQDSVIQTLACPNGTLPPIPCICADLNKSKTGLYRVTSTDLAILKPYYTKAESLLAPCGLGGGDSKGCIYYTIP